ncbi:acetyl-coenzyme A synthetase, chloroplastic/glyoxysomal isoform X1 [Cucumis sativus]|uniref:acetate--CoA ligase n=2 Tax=Cucumis sativus TaxID=3659 RepID=A0A0A0L7C4_CUCSA|nr:acetyl-coenzyme A synthetase, chloroplastic/glyoxysomal isoform X1 [Cucumis sativus]XP_011651338.1 acetyl-coenzyme A synthetase, chloroplastic/glyoxysomal isoform X1 [Cucumis sativus]XP_011651339.1 acetyl-coenzyme A synthetase, chloroplastic/glyoxysomal isoform X1 [Cucumis sativus]
MLNLIVTSSCNAVRPFPASSNPGILFPSAAAAINSDYPNPYFHNCKERHINTFHNHLYFNSTSSSFSSSTTTSSCLLRPPFAGSFLSSSLSTFSSSLTRIRGSDGDGRRDKNLSMGGLTDVAALESSAARKIPRLNAAVLGESPATEDDQLIFPSDLFSSNAHISSYHQYLEMYKRSIEDPAGFWSDIASSEFFWKQKWDQQVYSENLDVRKGEIKIEWFKGGITNICYNCLDRNIEAGLGEKIALYWEGNEPGFDGTLTYIELLHKVCQLANFLKDKGVRKGDAVVIYMPMLMELPIAMLACARIGAVHSVVFAGFSSESLAQRIIDCKPKIVITCNAVKRGSKAIHLKDIVDAALIESAQNGVSVATCLSYENESALNRESTKWKEGRDIWWQDVVPTYPTTCPVEWVDAEFPLFLLYTSGSTGKPKGVLHTTGGYMVYTATTFKYAFDYKPSDVYWCTADCGWITGHSYVTYGPLLNGASVVVFEGAPNYPDHGRCWDIVDKYKVTIFYTAPTLVRSLMREGNEHVTRYSRKSLRVLGSVGEPINPSAWRWFFNVVGESRCPISDTWWQTETGGFMITPLPGAWPQKPGSATFPFFGVQPVLVDEKGNEIEGECSGYLCLKSSWPSAFRTLYNDQERYEVTYFKPFPGYYFTGDGCTRDKDGYYWLTGRVDDVINVSGHRIGTAEVESALVSHPQCAEAAVVGVEHEVKGQGIYAFVTLVDGVSYSEELRKSLILTVRKQIGAFAAPDKIHWAPGLPKTRSGKIMRRILRKIASKQLDELGDTSTLADPGVVNQLIELADS